MKRWMFTISGPSVVSYLSSERGMLKFLALEKAFADGGWYDNNFTGTPGQDPCSDGCSEDYKPRKKEEIRRCVILYIV